jgi:2-C-methyl-D-erythritol 4-phosphate cytidylyltransferase
MYALIPCAGSGARAGSTEPKQYRDIAGLPMVIHTLRAFHAVARIKQGIVVVAPDDNVMRGLIQKFGISNFEVAEVAEHNDLIACWLVFMRYLQMVPNRTIGCWCMTLRAV